MNLFLLALLGVALTASAADPSPSFVQPKASEGCWARFYGEPDFKEPMGLLSGALYINSLAAPGFIGHLEVREYFSRVRSAAVGPSAQVIVYAAPGFDREIARVEPGQKVANLATIGFPQRVASLKIVCDRP
jgi:hypothetical protein